MSLPVLSPWGGGGVESPDKEADRLLIEKEWASDAKVSFKWLDMQSMRVGQVHRVWKFIPHDVRTIKRAYPKLRLHTGTNILQKNSARFDGCSLRDAACFVGMGLRLVHTLLQGAVCLRL